jgi:uncharacterized protein
MAAPSLDAIPLFPLPNVVLFPRAVLPLHIFEDRYKQMTADVLESDKRIAMALLKPGWEKDYYGRPPIEPVVCVGKILSWEQLDDGKYNFLLQGTARARVIKEEKSAPGEYRVAKLEALQETPTLEIDLESQRKRLTDIFEQKKVGIIPVARQFRELIASMLPTVDIVDLAAFNLLDNIPLKQRLLAECDVPKRIKRGVDALEEWAAQLNPGLAGFPEDPGFN